MPTHPFTHEGQPFQLVQEGSGLGSKFFVDGSEAAWMAVQTFPVPYPEENHSLKTTGRLVEDGKPGWETYSRLSEIRYDIEYAREVRRVNAEMRRQEELATQGIAEFKKLQERLNALREMGYYTQPARDALSSSASYSSGWNQEPSVWPADLVVPRKKIERLEQHPLQVLLESLPGRDFHKHNLHVLEEVRILSHRSGGKIEAVSPKFLLEYYADLVTSPYEAELDEEVLRFQVSDFVKDEELAGIELSPETVQIGDEQCRIEYIIDSDVVVTVVTMRLTTYQGYKDGLQEMLPEGELKLRLTRPKGGVIEGAPGDEITRRIRKAR